MIISSLIESNLFKSSSLRFLATSSSPSSSVEPLSFPPEGLLASPKLSSPELTLSGGRSSTSGLSVTVFGSSGFTGRAIVNRLGKIGSSIVLPYRGEPSNMRHLRVLGDLGQIAMVPCDVHRPDDVREVIGHSNLVINLVGRGFSTSNFSLEQTNVKAAANIAKACAELGVERLIHVSALGASPHASSEYALSKAAGEQQVLAHFPQATILRPSQIYGTADNLVVKLANLVRFHYVFPYVAPGRRFQPLWVSDFASAVMAVVADRGTQGKVYELGGPDVLTHRELLELISQHTEVPLSHAVELPEPLLRLMVRFWYRRFRSPAYSLEELDWYKEGDCLVNKNALSFQDLGVSPSSLYDHIAELTILYQRPKERYLV